MEQLSPPDLHPAHLQDFYFTKTIRFVLGVDAVSGLIY
jgi:hypothetical protein